MKTTTRWLCSAAVVMLLCSTGCSQRQAFKIPETSRQLLVVTSDGWSATTGTIRLFERAGAGWADKGLGDPVVLGKSGLGVGPGLVPEREASGLGGPQAPVKREGDGRSPAGVFTLGNATGYGDGIGHGATWPYEQATARLRCVDDTKSPLYNQLTLAPESGPAPWSSDEHMLRDDGLYAYTLFVEHNTRPAKPGGGSCIFLHIWRGRGVPTVGCTAVSDALTMEAVLSWLDPAKQPLLVQLPIEVYRRVTSSWGLPPLP